MPTTKTQPKRLKWILGMITGLFIIAGLAFLFTQTNFLKGASFGGNYYIKIELLDSSSNTLDGFTIDDFSSSYSGSTITAVTQNSAGIYVLTLNSAYNTDITIEKDGYVSQTFTKLPDSNRLTADIETVYYQYGYSIQLRRRVTPGEGGGATYETIPGATVTLSSGSESTDCVDSSSGYYYCPLSINISSAPDYSIEVEGYENVEGSFTEYRTSHSDARISEEVYTTLSTTLDFSFSDDPVYNSTDDSLTLTLNAEGLDSADFDSTQEFTIDVHLQGYDSSATYVSLHHEEIVDASELTEGAQEITIENLTEKLDIYEGDNSYDLSIVSDYDNNFEESDESNNRSYLTYTHPAYDMELNLSYDSVSGEVSAETCMNLLNSNYDPVVLNYLVNDAAGVSLYSDEIDLSMQSTGDCESNTLYTITAENTDDISVEAVIVNYNNNYLESDTENNADTLSITTDEFPEFETDDSGDDGSDDGDDDDDDGSDDDDDDEPMCLDLDIDPNTYKHNSDEPIKDLNFTLDIDAEAGWEGTMKLSSANDGEFTYLDEDGAMVVEEDSLEIEMSDERQTIEFEYDGDVNDEIYAYIEGEESRCNDTLKTIRDTDDDDEEKGDDDDDDSDDDEEAGDSGKSSSYSHPFIDVIDHWAEEFVAEAYSKGWVDGRSPTFFKPHNDITIAEFIKILLESNYEQPSNGTSQFWFLDPNDWAVPYIVRAEELDVVRTRDGLVSNFGLPITRCDAALYIARYKDLEYYLQEGEIAFDDVDVSGDHSYCAYAVHILSTTYVDTDDGEEAVIQGYGDGTFKPDKYIDRAEALTMLMKAAQL